MKTVGASATNTSVLKPMLEHCDACWGGDVGAELLTNYIEPQDYLIYSYKSHSSLMVKNRLRLAPQGRISIYSACWPTQNESMPMVAPTFVVYADLLSAQDPRCEEAAERLYQGAINRLLKNPIS